MKTERHYCIGSDLDDMEKVEQELEATGTLRPQIHVLTLDDTGAEHHHQLHDVQSLMKRDLIRSGTYGLLIGLCAAALVLMIAPSAGWTESPAGWIPFIFLAIILLGFFTWEGGLWGIQNQNAQFRRFEQELEDGNHVFFVDLRADQRQKLEQVMRGHPEIRFAGTGAGRPHWVMLWQHRLRHFLAETMP